MEIINQTCYSTEDLRNLYERVKAGYIERTENDSGWWKRHYKWKDPARLVIGYYKVRDQSDHYPSYTSLRRKPVTRLGIAKKADLPWGHALTALAEAANGKEASIPTRAIKQIVRTMIEIGGGYTGLVELPYVDGETVPHYYGGETDDCWVWIKDVTIRYRERAKRGTRKAAARARKLGRLDHMRKEIEQARENIAEQQALIRQHQADLVELEKELADSLAAMTAAEEALDKE